MYIEDLKNGKFKVKISNGKKADGKRDVLNKTIVAKNKTEAKKIATQMELEFKSSKPSQVNFGETLFIDFVRAWWQHKDTEIVERTRATYADLLQHSILPAFGNKKLNDITTKDIDDYMLSLTKNGIRRDGRSGGYSDKTRSHYFNLLYSIFKQAQAWGYVNLNACENAKRPKLKKAEKGILSESEVTIMLETVKQAELVHQALLNLFVYTGARRSEIVGLQWGDIDFNTKEITFRRTVHSTKSAGVYTQPGLKDGEPTRRVSIPKGLYDALLAYKLSDNFNNTDYLFHSVNDTKRPSRPESLSRWLARFIKRYNLKPISLHGIRHTSVSLLIASGLDPYTVARRHGHSVEVCLKIYTHMVQQNQEKVIDTLDSMF